METCQHFRRHLSRFLNGDVEGPLKQRLDRHLSECEECSQLLSGASRLIGELKAGERMAAPPGFASRLARRIQEIKSRPAGILGRMLGWLVPDKFTERSLPAKALTFGAGVALAVLLVLVTARVVNRGETPRHDRIIQVPVVNEEMVPVGVLEEESEPGQPGVVAPNDSARKGSVKDIERWVVPVSDRK